MEFLRASYRTQARLFSDSDEEVTIHWYSVPRENGTLPFPTTFLSSDWDTRPDLGHLGEIYGSPRPFDGKGRIIPPPPCGDCQLGDPAQFVEGVPYDPNRPPTPRGEDGVPLACRPAIEGVVIGGSGVPADGGVLLSSTAGPFTVLTAASCVNAQPSGYGSLVPWANFGSQVINGEWWTTISRGMSAARLRVQVGFAGGDWDVEAWLTGDFIVPCATPITVLPSGTTGSIHDWEIDYPDPARWLVLRCIYRGGAPANYTPFWLVRVAPAP